MPQNGHAPRAPKDRIEAAIDASKPVEKRAAIQVAIESTGRLVQITVPADMTDAEVREFTGWFLAVAIPKLRAETQQEQRRPSGLVIAGRLPT